MKIIPSFALSLTLTTSLFSQSYPDNVRVVCTCEVYKFKQSPLLRNSGDYQVFIIAPNCPLHKPPVQAAPEDFYLFKKRKKTKSKNKRNEGSHIIWLWPLGISNIEQGISNFEVAYDFDIQYSLFDIRYSLPPWV